MKIAEREDTAQIPTWTVEFLRDRSDRLQRRLADPADPVFTSGEEEDSIHCWVLLWAALEHLPATVHQPLEDLQLLHARVAERIDRGGVADISPEVEQLVRAVLCERLDRLTAEVLRRLA